jgi:16S rRNA (guanine527-N7)-methyltransferase
MRRIHEVAAATGLTLDAAALGALAVWLDTLAVWNARMDLTAAKTADDTDELMLTDAFVIASRVPAGASVVDVGSGAGAPGLAIALARPDLRVVLVEPLGKRVSFLRTVIGTVRRTDVTVVPLRGEDVIETFDVAVSRATLEPAEWLRIGATLVRPGGSVWVLVASREALPDPPSLLMSLAIDYELPFSRKARVAARFEKT